MTHAIHLDAIHAAQPSLLARLGQSFAQHLEYRAICSELNALSDRQLADIGLSRLNVRETAHATVYAR